MGPVDFLELLERLRSANDSHHLYENNRTWWMRVMVEIDGRNRRLSFSLSTRDREEAKRRRDELLHELDNHPTISPPHWLPLSQRETLKDLARYREIALSMRQSPPRDPPPLPDSNRSSLSYSTSPPGHSSFKR